ncbi:hypothetical protein E2N92_00800 [Methanofollis formosanus]|uniref:Uncharacterized protein n=1 Tax=Methanofollis formosanus TaxID=299308 RepID=A0A8G1A0A2_9EURY|nr:hypothetical protein [Methanofollis formosanus]QYZ78069.1 hypothetical protein E2N92_00800 [Methanofollis formosanus]
MALIDMLKNRNQKIESNSVASSKNECYICRRSEEEIAALTATMTEEVDQKIQVLQARIRSKKAEVTEYYQSIIDQLEGNQYLDFKIETIKTDIPQFGTKIPNVNEIVQKSCSDSETVLNVVERLNESIHQIATDPAYDIGQDHPEIKEAYDEIRSLEEEKHLIADTLKLRSRAVHPGTGGPGQISIHLCGICSGLLEEAGRGSYAAADDPAEE